jgi:cyclophilin family peptidyl-prolyl cis-trans isomerase
MKHILLTILLTLMAGQLIAAVVRFETNYGNIDIEMKEEAAPLNVANFLNYVSRGDYDESIIHRTDGGSPEVKFVQGGEFHIRNGQVASIPEDSQVVNEFNISNTRATLSMAKIQGQPDSATNNFFFNLLDNSQFFDVENEGYTVIGEVIDGIEILDLIGSLRVVQGTPVISYIPGTVANQQNYVYINRAFILSDVFQINVGLSGAWFNPNTNGQGFYLEVLPTINTIIMAWFTFDTEEPEVSVPSTIGAAGNRWLTIAGQFNGNQFAGDIIKTSDGLFDDPTPVISTQAGSVAVTFEDCGHASLSYSLDGSNLVNEIPLQRISGANIDFCEEQASLNAAEATVTQ